MDMQRKQAVLAAKQEVIGGVLEKAYDAVMDLDDEKYFEMLEKLLEKHALAEDGMICFSAKDLERMPQDSREDQEYRRIKRRKPDPFRETGESDGGFLLVYGGIEENCTIRAVFDSKREELSDQVNRLLFG